MCITLAAWENHCQVPNQRQHSWTRASGVSWSAAHRQSLQGERSPRGRRGSRWTQQRGQRRHRRWWGRPCARGNSQGTPARSSRPPAVANCDFPVIEIKILSPKAQVSLQQLRRTSWLRGQWLWCGLGRSPRCRSSPDNVLVRHLTR